MDAPPGRLIWTADAGLGAERQVGSVAMSTHAVNSENEDLLARRLAALGVRDEDIGESFVRSGGHGGQNVNKTSTCVMLVHRPTGIQVKCQTTRHQAQNRFLARSLLADKIEAARASRIREQRDQAEKLRRQKRGRSKAAKRRILADKAHHAGKKASRRQSFND